MYHKIEYHEEHLHRFLTETSQQFRNAENTNATIHFNEYMYLWEEYRYFERIPVQNNLMSSHFNHWKCRIVVTASLFMIIYLPWHLRCLVQLFLSFIVGERLNSTEVFNILKLCVTILENAEFCDFLFRDTDIYYMYVFMAPSVRCCDIVITSSSGGL